MKPKIMNDIYNIRPTIRKIKTPLYLFIKDIEIKSMMPDYYMNYDLTNKNEMVPVNCNSKTQHDFLYKSERRPDPNSLSDDDMDDDEEEETPYRKYKAKKNQLSSYEYCKSTQYYPKTPSNMVAVMSCISQENFSCTLYVHGFRPYFYVNIDDNYLRMDVLRLYNFMLDNFCDWADSLDKKAKYAAISYEIVVRKRGFGWESDHKTDLKTNQKIFDDETRKTHRYIKFSFANQNLLNDWKCILSKKYRDQVKDPVKKRKYETLYKCMSMIKKTDPLNGFGVYETKVTNDAKLIGMLQTSYCSWIRVDKFYECERLFVYSQVELNADIEDVVSMPDMNAMPEIVSVSFDTEWTCKDMEFTNVFNPNDGIICITNNVEIMFEDKTVKDTDPINIAYCVGQFDYNHDYTKDPQDKQNQKYIVKCFYSELECIDQWMTEMTENIGADWFTTYNGDGFDWKHIITRARWLSNPKYVKHFYISHYERKSNTHKNLINVLKEKGDEGRSKENHEKHVLYDLFLKFLTQTFELFGEDQLKLKKKQNWICQMNNYIYQWNQIVERETNHMTEKKSWKDKYHAVRKNDQICLIQTVKQFLTLKLKQFLHHYIPAHEYQDKHRKIKSSLDTKKYFLDRSNSQKDKQRLNGDGNRIHKKTNNHTNHKKILIPQTINVHEDTVTLCDFSGAFINSHIEPNSKIMTVAGQDMEMFRPNCSSRVNFDMYRYIRMEKKLQSYSLNNVAKELLKDEKVEMPYELMFRNYDGEKGIMNWNETMKMRNNILEYGFKDSMLPQDLLKKLKIIQETFVFAKTSYTKPDSIWSCGQQIKIWNYSVYQSHKDNFIIDRDPYDSGNGLLEENMDDESGYQGARVLEPVNANYDYLVSTLDYKSLYPSIMRAYNLCISTLMKHEDTLRMNLNAYFEIKTEDDEVHYFKKTQDSIYPKILTNLGKMREEVKDQMEKCVEGSIEHQLLDKKQLAIKKLMNSFYGALAAKFGMISEKCISQCVTAKGREIIDQTVIEAKKSFKDNFEILPKIIRDKVKDITIIYGDSVTGSMPSLFRINKRIFVETVETVCQYLEQKVGFKWMHQSSSGKYVMNCQCMGLNIWSSEGWTPINLILKHQINLNSKKIFRVETDSSSVDVTEDHSLLDFRGNKVTPSYLIHQSDPLDLMARKFNFMNQQIFDLLDSNNLKTSWVQTKSQKYEWLIGYFIGNHLKNNVQLKNTGNKKYIGLKTKNMDALICVQDFWSDIEADGCYCHYKYENSEHCLKIFLEGKNSLFDSMMIIMTNFKLPEMFLQHQRSPCEQFMRGFMMSEDSDNLMKDGMFKLCFHDNMVLCQQFNIILRTLGYKSIKMKQVKHENMEQQFLMINFIIENDPTQLLKHCHNENRVQKITDMTEHYKKQGDIIHVYDFETSNQTFQSGMGQVIVHNTDSIMLCYNGLRFTWENIKAASEASNIISDSINAYWNSLLDQKVLILENEKTCRNFLLMGKKHYLAWSYEPKHINKRVESQVKTTKGLDIIKRGTLSIASKYGYKMINSYFGTDNPEYNCLMACIDCMRKLFENRFDIKDLVMSKTLKASYEKSKTLPSHANVAEKIKQRSPGQEPKIGDRVYYVYISQECIHSDKISDRSEDVVYALENQLPLDIAYYIDLCFKKFEAVLEALYENIGVLKHFINEKKKKLSNSKTRTMVINNAGTLSHIVQDKKTNDLSRYIKPKFFQNKIVNTSKQNQSSSANSAMYQNTDYLDSEWKNVISKLVIRKKNKPFIPEKMQKSAKKEASNAKIRKDVLFAHVTLNKK